MTAALFLLSQPLLAVLGGAALFSRYVRRFTILGRCAFSFLAGALFLTIEATLFSLVRIPWSVASLAVPLLILTAFAVGRRRRPARSKVSDARPVAPLLPIAVSILSAVHLAVAIATTRATSPDYVLFWAVKGIRFAAARAIDAAFLTAPFSTHTHINYPPLVPVAYTWGILVAGEFPWLVGTLLSWFWFVATLPVLYSILRIRMTREHSAIVTAFWSAAMALSVAAGFNGGNADTPLLAYETLACALILVTPPQLIREVVVPLSILFAGAVLTKQEGSIAVILLILAGVLRDWLITRTSAVLAWLRALLFPAVSIGLWWTFSWMHDIPLTDPIREKALAISFDHVGTIAIAALQNLHAGSWGLSWLLVIAALIVLRQAWREIFPALFFAAGLLIFSFVFFLHIQADHEMVIIWTLPRLSQPALSVLILAAGVASFGRLLDEDSGVADDRAVVTVDVA